MKVSSSVGKELFYLKICLELVEFLHLFVDLLQATDITTAAAASTIFSFV